MDQILHIISQDNTSVISWFSSLVIQNQNLRVMKNGFYFDHKATIADFSDNLI